MDYIPPENQWYAEATLLDGKSLQFIDRFRVDFIQHRSNLSAANMIVKDLVRCWRVSRTRFSSEGAVDLLKLANFFGKRHFSHEYSNPIVDISLLLERAGSRSSAGSGYA